MSTIDERIVSMKFDNRGFADGIRSTLSMLDRLKSALSFRGSTAGIDEVQTAANRFSMGNIIGQINNVTSQFSILGMTAANVLGNVIYGQIQKLQSQMGQFTTQPISDGFQEYELNMGSIQTILTNTASKGSKLPDVTKALDELNTYADKTVYSFSEMTKNIGTFTAAGVGLEDATTAIKGISNLGAASGSNSQQVATAMYQMSQALAAGKVGLMDWNSLVNAGMGGQLMQDALIETSRALGTGADAAIAKAGSFRESLQEGWITADVLRQTFANFAGDIDEAALKAQGFTDAQIENIKTQSQMALEAATVMKTFSQVIDTTKESLGSGWAKSWQIVVGDFEEAKKLWTAVGNEITGTIDRMSDKRNELLQGWKDLGGRTNLLEGLANAYQGIKERLTGLFDGFRSVVPALSAQKLFDITSKISAVLSKLKPQGDIIYDSFRWLGTGLGTLFNGVWRIIAGTSAVISEAFRGIRLGLGWLKPDKEFTFMQTLAYALGDALSFVGNILTNIGRAIQYLNHDFAVFMLFRNIASVVASSLKIVFDFIQGIGIGIMDNLGDGPSIFMRIAAAINQVIMYIGRAIHGVAIFLGKIAQADTASNFGQKIGGAVYKLGEIFAKVFGSIGKIVGSVFGFIANIPIGNIFGGLGRRFGQLTEVFSAFGAAASKVMSAFIPSWQGFGTFLETLGGIFKSFIDGMAYGISTLGKALLDVFSGDGFNGLLDGINTGLLAVLVLSIKNFLGKGSLFEQLKGMIFGSDDEAEDAEKEPLLKRLKKMIVGDEDGGGLFDGIGEKVSEALSPLTDTLDAMQQTLRASSLMQIAIAIGVLTVSVVALATIDSGALTKSLTAITVMFGQLAGMLYIIQAMNFTKVGASLPSIGLGLALVAAAIALLAIPVIALSTLNWEELAKGLVGVGVLLLELSYASTIMAKSSKGLVSTGIGLTILAIGINILVKAVEKMGALDIPTLAKGLGGVAVLLGSLALFTKFSTAGKGSVAASIQILILAAALVVLSKAVSNLGSMDLPTLGKGLASVGASLVILAGSMRLMPANMPLVAAGLLVASAAIVVLAKALQMIGSMSGGDSFQALATLGVSLGLLAIGVNAMTGAMAGAAALTLVVAALTLFTPVLITLGSLPWSVILTGLGTLALTFGILGVAGYLLAPVVPVIIGLSASLGMLALSVAGIILAIGLLAIAFGTLAAGIAMLAQTGKQALTDLFSLFPLFFQSLGEGIIALLEALTQSGQAIVNFIVTIISSVLEAIGTMLPEIVTTVGTVLSSLMTLVIEKTPEIVQTFIVVMQGILNAITTLTPDVVNAVIAVCTGILQAVQVLTPQVVQTGVDMVMAFVNAIVALIPFLVDAGMRLIIGILDGIARNIGELVTKGADVIVNFLQGIQNNVGRIADEGAKTVIAFINGVADSIRTNAPALREAARNLGWEIINGLTGGLAEKVGSAIQKAADVGNSVLSTLKTTFGINSPSRYTREFGEGLIEGLVLGQDRSSHLAEKSAAKLGNKTLQAIRDELGKGVDDIVMKPTITPVVDMSKAHDDLSALNDTRNFVVPATNMSQDIQQMMTPTEATIKSLGKITNVTINQTNTSPRALDEVEIYRQTKNTIAQIKKEVFA